MVEILPFLEKESQLKLEIIIFFEYPVSKQILISRMSAKMLISSLEFSNAKSRDEIPFECEQCGKRFYRTKSLIQRCLKGTRKPIRACSPPCIYQLRTNSVNCSCAQCGGDVIRRPSEIVQSKTGNVFCSKSCAATFNNTHFHSGTNRSKLEKWIENQLNIQFPSIEILYNESKTIGMELDIYIPSLKLAFELNGIFHYEPVWGNERLEKCKRNDSLKFQICQSVGISLCVIDTHNVKYHKKERDQKFLNIIIDLIRETWSQMKDSTFRPQFTKLNMLPLHQSGSGANGGN